MKEVRQTYWEETESTERNSELHVPVIQYALKGAYVLSRGLCLLKRQKTFNANITLHWYNGKTNSSFWNSLPLQLSVSSCFCSSQAISGTKSTNFLTFCPKWYKKTTLKFVSQLLLCSVISRELNCYCFNLFYDFLSLICALCYLTIVLVKIGDKEPIQGD